MGEAVTHQELKAVIDTMSAEQLAQPVRWIGEECGGTIASVWILEEDHLDFGEGIERASDYADDPNAREEAVRVIPKGTPFLEDL